MNALVIYFSATGNTREVALMIAEQAGADIYEIKLQKPLPESEFGVYVKGISMMLKKKNPALKEDFPPLSAYDIVFIGTPVWGSKMAPPLKAFLEACPLGKQKTALFVCYKASGYEGCFKDMREALKDQEIVGELALTDHLAYDSDCRANSVKAWLEKIDGE